MEKNAYVYSVKELGATLTFQTEQAPNADTLDELTAALREGYEEFAGSPEKPTELMEQRDYENLRNLQERRKAARRF